MRFPSHPCPVMLVVDDDTLVSMGTAAMLEDLGHDVTEASAAAAALQIVRRVSISS